MKKLFCLFLLSGFLFSFRTDSPRVLLYLEDNSAELQYMLIHEVGQMKEILEHSGFQVSIATLNGEILKTDSITLKPDLRLRDVNIKDYAGFMIPCMATNDTIITAEEKNFVKTVSYQGKPLAAQMGGIWILAKAGILDGRKYAIFEDPGNEPAFKKAIYSGNGVVKDGNIITSGICPWMAKMSGQKDGTAELTNTMVAVIKEKIKNP
jgi:putative intracellular protease/amidase